MPNIEAESIVRESKSIIIEKSWARCLAWRSERDNFRNTLGEKPLFARHFTALRISLSRNFEKKRTWVWVWLRGSPSVFTSLFHKFLTASVKWKIKASHSLKIKLTSSCWRLKLGVSSTSRMILAVICLHNNNMREARTAVNQSKCSSHSHRMKRNPKTHKNFQNRNVINKFCDKLFEKPDRENRRKSIKPL